MKVALAHDYLGEFGGAERVLLALSDIYPDAPIYTAFKRRGPALERFKSRKIKTSWVHYIPGFSKFFYSPLRFLAPLIWGSFDFSKYDLVISSASWYVTKGFGARGSSREKPIEICYCHTPPRYLYGYPTSVEWKKNLLARVYALLVNHFMRMYDFSAAQKVDYFIANSENVRKRIKKFYRRDAKVIYPPVELFSDRAIDQLRYKDMGYYLVVSRIVGSKGLEMAVEAANKLKIKLKVVGSPAGYGGLYKRLKELSGPNIEFLGYVEDSELVQLYSKAKAFLALAQDEDFGITPVEALQAGVPVIAFKGGGYTETVTGGKTGVFFEEYTTKGLIEGIKRFEKTKINPTECIKQGKKFSKDVFGRKFKEFVSTCVLG